MTTRAGIYVRISDDQDGNSTAIERQLQDCEAFAKAQGWEVVDTFQDPDLSAYKRGVIRPEFQRLLDAVRQRKIDVAVAWKIDRLSRRRWDFVWLDEACEQSGAFIATATGGVDTRNATGRFLAELLVSQARMESANQSDRLRRKHAERVQKGIPNRGGDRLFGYDIKRESVIEAEAALIREAAQRVIMGESLRGICLDWDRRGVRTTSVRIPGGTAWRQTPLRRLLTSAAIAGCHEVEGVLKPGIWPGVLSIETLEHLRLILRNPERRTTGRREPRSYLLSGGLLRCAKPVAGGRICGTVMVARPRTDGKRRYVCARQPSSPACGQMAAMAEPLEALIVDSILDRFRGHGLADFTAKLRDSSTGPLLQRLQEAQSRLSEVDRLWAAGEIDTTRWQRLTSNLKDSIAATEREVAQHRAGDTMASILASPISLEEKWATAAFDWRRAVVRAFLREVAITPARRGRNKFDPCRVHLTWAV